MKWNYNGLIFEFKADGFYINSVKQLHISGDKVYDMVNGATEGLFSFIHGKKISYNMPQNVYEQIIDFYFYQDRPKPDNECIHQYKEIKLFVSSVWECTKCGKTRD